MYKYHHISESYWVIIKKKKNQSFMFRGVVQASYSDKKKHITLKLIRHNSPKQANNAYFSETDASAVKGGYNIASELKKLFGYN